MMSTALLSALPGWYLHGGVALLGLLLGSFMNAVIYRLPLMITQPEQNPTLNLAFPGSHCPTCQAPLRAWHNIPVLSWILLRGHCHACGIRIPARYPCVELLCGLLFLGASYLFYTPFDLLCALAVIWFLLALSLIDISTYLLPDTLTLPLLWLGLLAHSVGGTLPLQDALYGAVAGYLALWLLYWGFKLTTGREGMGYGDFKLLAALGAWLGWQVLPMLCLLAALVGIAAALARRLLQDKTGILPFGPCLALAGMVIYICQAGSA